MNTIIQNQNYAQPCNKITTIQYVVSYHKSRVHVK